VIHNINFIDIKDPIDSREMEDMLETAQQRVLVYFVEVLGVVESSS
jgi:hypothetical protein